MLIHVVARDVRITTGMNLQLVRDLTGRDPWSCLGSQVKNVMAERLALLPEQDSSLCLIAKLGPYKKNCEEEVFSELFRFY